MLQSAYKITITNPGSLVAPNDGFIDVEQVQFYLSVLTGTDVPSDFTYALSQAKRRANLRYHQLILQGALIGNLTFDPASISAPSASYNTEPTSISFNIIVEKGDGSLGTWDELNPTTLLTGAAALTRVFARALTWSQTVEVDVYDPTPLTTIGNSTPSPRFGSRIAPLVVGPISPNLISAATLITVTQLIAST